MTPADRLQPHITAAYRGEAPDADSFLQAFRDDPEMLACAREEIARLRAPGRRVLAEHDHESKIRCQTLERMVREFDEK